MLLSTLFFSCNKILIVLSKFYKLSSQFVSSCFVFIFIYSHVFTWSKQMFENSFTVNILWNQILQKHILNKTHELWEISLLLFMNKGLLKLNGPDFILTKTPTVIKIYLSRKLTQSRIFCNLKKWLRFLFVKFILYSLTLLFSHFQIQQSIQSGFRT